MGMCGKICQMDDRSHISRFGKLHTVLKDNSTSPFLSKLCDFFCCPSNFLQKFHAEISSLQHFENLQSIGNFENLQPRPVSCSFDWEIWLERTSTSCSKIRNFISGNYFQTWGLMKRVISFSRVTLSWMTWFHDVSEIPSENTGSSWILRPFCASSDDVIRNGTKF